jgi:aconitate hydratase
MTSNSTLTSGGRRYRIVDLPGAAGDRLRRLPWVHRILIENVLRHAGGHEPVSEAVGDWIRTGTSEREIPFHPSRVLMHDTTCGPALVDIAASRAALAEAGGDPARLNPVLRVDVTTDHSLSVEFFARPDAASRNAQRELERNAERYRLMKWATQAVRNVTVHPPGTGIIHTLNLERLATVVATQDRNGEAWAVPDTVIGTDSHTPMVNGIGVLGWGVGGLEAESVMLGMPVMMRVPGVVGVRLTGRLRDGVLASDLALTLTGLLRRNDPGGRFVEFFGDGVSTLAAGVRAVVASMAPEFGGSSGYFPIDDRTLQYLAATGRPPECVALVGEYARRQSLWFDPAGEPAYDDVIELDLASVGLRVAGPRRPHDTLSPSHTRRALEAAVVDAATGMGRRAASPAIAGDVPDGAVAIAAITGCTNTSDPGLLVAAGLLARKARGFGLRPKPWVKTSLAPGSPTAERYLRRAGLLEDLEALGFAIVGYGCTTCIGNSGDLLEPIVTAVGTRDIVPVAVLSGNRNFPGRVHSQIEAAFLASPALVVAYALAGDVMRDILSDPIGISAAGSPVTLADLWPSAGEIEAVAARAVDAADYDAAYGEAEASAAWRALEAPAATLYPWDAASTYIRRPPFAACRIDSRLGRYLAHPLLVVGDDVTTDHISPAGRIPVPSDAADYLVAMGEDRRDLNVFSARRGNWKVMLRGLFTNRSVQNLLGDRIPPGRTVHAGSGELSSIRVVAERYRADNEPVVVVAGERYGMGSSRDWAAKGVSLLGVRAVLAVSFERIHRANLVHMGVLPLQLPPEQHPCRLRLRPGDRVEIDAPAEGLAPGAGVAVAIRYAGGDLRRFEARAAVETSLEVRVLAQGGIIPMILQETLRGR